MTDVPSAIMKWCDSNWYMMVSYKARAKSGPNSSAPANKPDAIPPIEFISPANPADADSAASAAYGISARLSEAAAAVSPPENALAPNAPAPITGAASMRLFPTLDITLCALVTGLS